MHMHIHKHTQNILKKKSKNDMKCYSNENY